MTDENPSTVFLTLINNLNQWLGKLDEKIDLLSSKIDGKADKAQVNQLGEKLDGKADKAEFIDLRGRVDKLEREHEHQNRNRSGRTMWIQWAAPLLASLLLVLVTVWGFLIK